MQATIDIVIQSEDGRQVTATRRIECATGSVLPRQLVTAALLTVDAVAASGRALDGLPPDSPEATFSIPTRDGRVNIAIPYSLELQADLAAVAPEVGRMVTDGLRATLAEDPKEAS